MQFSLVDSKYASRFISSANPIPKTPSQGQLQISCNSTIYSRKRIRDKGEPCRTLASTENEGVLCPWIIRVVVRVVIKACTYRMSQCGSRFFLKISNNRMGLTISNAPKISIERSVATCRLELQIVWTYLVRSSNAILVDLPTLAPIWESSSK